MDHLSYRRTFAGRAHAPSCVFSFMYFGATLNRKKLGTVFNGLETNETSAICFTGEVLKMYVL